MEIANLPTCVNARSVSDVAIHGIIDHQVAALRDGESVCFDLLLALAQRLPKLEHSHFASYSNTRIPLR